MFVHGGESIPNTHEKRPNSPGVYAPGCFIWYNYFAFNYIFMRNIFNKCDTGR